MSTSARRAKEAGTQGSGASEPRTRLRDAVIDEQAVLKEFDDRALVRNPENDPDAAADRPWREPVRVEPEEAGDRVWAGSEATGKSGGGMPEAASQANDPGTDTDIMLPRAKKRVAVDRA